MTTAVQVQYRRGTGTQVAAFTGAQGEIVVDTTNNRAVVQDSATAGGFPLARLNQDLSGGFLNKFRNATMDVWQRGTSGAATTTAGASTQTGPDGWYIVPTGASVAWAQAGGRLLTKSSLQVIGASSATDVIVKQRIESLMAAAFCSQTVTVQAWVYNNTGGSITPALTIKRPTAQDNYASTTTDVSAVNLQSCANGQWTQVAYTFAANASCFNGLEVSFDFGNNFSANTKSIQFAEPDIRVTSGVTNVGAVNNSPPWAELRPIGIELPLNMRYYWRWTAGAISVPVAMFQAFAATKVWGKLFDLPQVLRGNPNCNASSPGHFTLYTTAGATPITAVDFTGSIAQTLATFSGWTSATASLSANECTFLYTINAGAWIDASAEL
jgi:hypothetical protein